MKKAIETSTLIIIIAASLFAFALFYLVPEILSSGGLE
jgi:hypothetical protein